MHLRVITKPPSRKSKVRDCVVTVGAFDGIHIGHRKILREVLLLAKGLKCRSLVITFDPHPLSVLEPAQAPMLLTTLEEKIKLIAEAGIDDLLIMRFTPRLAARSPEWFVKELLVKRIGMRRLVIGYDFRFGKARGGDASYLRAAGENLGFGVDIVPPVLYRGHPVSSTRVRTAIARGEVENASAMLGRPYALRAKVVCGEGRGRKLDYPTANLKPEEEKKMLPAKGVYAVQVITDAGKLLPGALYIGSKPTFGGFRVGIEVHMIGLVGNLYGREVEVHFLRRIRDERVFRSESALRRQIGKDVEEAARIIGN